jgi:YD repeat-containing protein
MRTRRSISGVLMLLALGRAGAEAQQASILYLYDELNRLTGVVDQQGNVATYAYDAVGNILRIERFDAGTIAGAVGITFVAPNQGVVDAGVQIFGKGFSPTPGQNAVTFNGVPALVTSGAPNRLITKVPPGATTGLIRVTTPLGSAVSPTPFRVIGTLSITPAGDIVLVGASRQFTATDGGNVDTAFVWSVNGVTSGTATVGTVTGSGLYTAPSSVPGAGAVTLTARVGEGPAAATTSAQILVIGTPLPVVTPARPVSVQTATSSASGPAVASAPAVSATIASAGNAAPAFARAAVARQPFISAVTPATAAPGASDLIVTITGSGFAGATDITFLRNNAPDTSIIVSAPAVSAEGAQLTITISVAAGAPSGARVVKVTTSSGSSTPLGITGNTFTVQ